MSRASLACLAFASGLLLSTAAHRARPRQAVTSPPPVVADSAPLAVRVGDKVLIQGVVRAVVPHGKGVVVEIQPVKEGK